MLRIYEQPLPANSSAVLAALQHEIDAVPDYAHRVIAAKKAWAAKTSTRAKTDAFRAIRSTLASMCIGSVRCAYCEDSLADEVEHIRPKNFFPEHVFVWENYLFACGPCNGPKGNRYRIVNNDAVDEFVRAVGGAVVSPPAGLSALIDPRSEDPMDFLELDLGGTTPDGEHLPGTFEFLPSDAADPVAQLRAVFSIEVLGLNREVIRVARENAFGGFRARLREYCEEKEEGADPQRLNQLKNDILLTPHITVFAEMRRQRKYLPAIDILFDVAPEAEVWPIVPNGS